MPSNEVAGWADLDDRWLEELTHTCGHDRTETVSPVEAGWVLDLLGRAVMSRFGFTSGPEAVAHLQARARLVSTAQAGLLEAMNRIVDEYEELSGDLELAHEGAVAEIRAALTLTRRAAESDLNLAADLCRRVPDVLAA